MRRCSFERSFDLADQVGVVGEPHQSPHFILIVRRQIFQAIDALIDIRQRQQIKQNIDGRQHPDKEAIADEIAAQRR